MCTHVALIMAGFAISHRYCSKGRVKDSVFKNFFKKFIDRSHQTQNKTQYQNTTSDTIQNKTQRVDQKSQPKLVNPSDTWSESPMIDLQHRRGETHS